MINFTLVENKSVNQTEKYSFVSKFKFPSWVGIVPLRWFEDKTLKKRSMWNKQINHTVVWVKSNSQIELELCQSVDLKIGLWTNKDKSNILIGWLSGNSATQDLKTNKY